MNFTTACAHIDSCWFGHASVPSCPTTVNCQQYPTMSHSQAQHEFRSEDPMRYVQMKCQHDHWKASEANLLDSTSSTILWWVLFSKLIVCKVFKNLWTWHVQLQKNSDKSQHERSSQRLFVKGSGKMVVVSIYLMHTWPVALCYLHAPLKIAKPSLMTQEESNISDRCNI